MEAIFKHHLERVRSQTLDKFTLDKIPEWIESHTTIGLDKFSFDRHEYQETILRDTSQEIVVIKCSQIGMTEASIRLALALCSVVQNYKLIYTLPTATFASNVMTTRVDPIISDSPFLSSMLSKSINNSEIKKIGDSLMYMKGSATGNAPISIPADHIISDEVDFCDLQILELYQSRLTHSQYKRRSMFSTPTLPGYGIHEAFGQSRRHVQIVTCSHCNHNFVPDYYKDIKIPGFDGDLKEVTKRNLHKFNWRQAELLCPKCGKVPDMSMKYREWVIENPDEAYLAAGYHITPFCAPEIIKPSDLIMASTKYERRSQFVNFSLGLPMEDSDTAITRDDLKSCLVAPGEVGSGIHVLGIDVGATSYATVLRVMPDGREIVVHTETITAGLLMSRKSELCLKYRIRVTVIDGMPYSETVIRMQDRDANTFAAFYVTRQSIELQTVTTKEENKEKGNLEVKQVNINRNRAFDILMADIKGGHLKKIRSEDDELWIDHLTDMKRVQKFNRDNELEYQWVKSSKPEDHYHHSLVYAQSAARMLGVETFKVPRGSLLGKMKIKSKY